jgi:hypothetical protein
MHRIAAGQAKWHIFSNHNNDLATTFQAEWQIKLLHQLKGLAPGVQVNSQEQRYSLPTVSTVA